MKSPGQIIKDVAQWPRSEWIAALVMMILGALFIARGIYVFHVRPEHFGWLSVLGCVGAAFGSFFLLIVTTYVYHHAPLVFIPWFISLVYFSMINPYLGVGIGLALWWMLASQLSS